MAHIQFNLNFDELKEKILTSNLDDILKSTMVLVLNEYMKQEQTDYLNAQSYERSSDRRDYRNGYYERELLMSIGNVPLRVPRTHSGEFHTSAFEKYERSDQSFLLALVEMVIIITLTLLAAFGSFVAEPIFSWMKLYDLNWWKYIYSFPIYIVMGIGIKALTEKMISIQTAKQ